ncbi:MAG TPA: DUF3300 domain-containing protein [Syntrophobacteria bacterium]|nr:DUF3300 domain-containing protein [Syntrophobacteria bacterium]
MNRTMTQVLSLVLALALVLPAVVCAQGSPAFKQEELDQLLAPVALYPDSLLTQILMASTYPLEVVQAARWVKQNKDLKGDALTAALEKQPWDASVKSLVNFPQVLEMMNDKLDWTQKLGDAFLAQEKEVMGTIQSLRAKAYAEGNLKTTKEQTVIVEKDPQIIIIQPASPQIVYVPTYSPTVVYGVWAYPAYPPYPVYPPGYVATTAAFSFAAGVAVGAAWGYAWGHSDWHGGDIDVDVNRNTNINRNIDRGKYATQYQGGQGKWQHNPEHRKGVAYRDQGTAQKFNRGPSATTQDRAAYRGRADAGRQEPGRGGAGQSRDLSSGGRQTAQQRPASADRQAGQQRGDRSAFGGYEGGGETRQASNRGRESLSSARAGGSQGGRGGGGGSRGGGGGGGGRRR